MEVKDALRSDDLELLPLISVLLLRVHPQTVVVSLKGNTAPPTVRVSL